MNQVNTSGAGAIATATATVPVPVSVAVAGPTCASNSDESNNYCNNKTSYTETEQGIDSASDSHSEDSDSSSTGEVSAIHTPMGPEDRKLAVHRCLQALQHACVCKCELDRECDVFHVRCDKMKRVLAHEKKCPRKLNGDCTICKQLIALCCYHAKDCRQLSDCPVPYCGSIKQKLCDRIVACRQRRLFSVLEQRKQHIQESIGRFRQIYMGSDQSQSGLLGAVPAPVPVPVSRSSAAGNVMPTVAGSEMSEMSVKDGNRSQGQCQHEDNNILRSSSFPSSEQIQNNSNNLNTNPAERHCHWDMKENSTVLLSSTEK